MTHNLSRRNLFKSAAATSLSCLPWVALLFLAHSHAQRSGCYDAC